jgi:hypothetical protein
VKGDFSDIRFDPHRHFSGVLMQQGRVVLDTDANEAKDIFLYLLRSLAADLIGPAGAPFAHAGFAIDKVLDTKNNLVDLTIAPGRYYVDGILCELEADAPISYRQQPDYLLSDDDRLPESLPFLVYLDVWERFVSAAEDDSIREVALGGPDTCGRSHVVWQVRVLALESASGCGDLVPAFDDIVDELQPATRGSLRARALRPSDTDDDACVLAPEVRYRGQENQLYRVEIHRGGVAWDPNGQATLDTATFKWSRDNGSIAFPILDFTDEVVTLEYLGRDQRTDLREGDVVEVQYEGWLLGDTSRTPTPPPLLEVATIDRDTLGVTLTGDLGPVTDDLRAGPKLLRRWERSAWAAEGATGVAEDGTILVREAAPGGNDTTWLELEAGVQVQFVAPDGAAGVYRSGDYWLIPARTETGDVRWPQRGEGDPAAVPPQGVVHHYAPLAVLFENADGLQVAGCRCVFRTDCERQGL